MNLKNNISNCRPGLGKSTTAQLLSKNHGFVYYECDCFFNGKNPYIPPHVENPSVTQLRQRRLVGEGAEERRRLNEKVGNVFLPTSLIILIGGRFFICLSKNFYRWSTFVFTRYPKNCYRCFIGVCFYPSAKELQ